MENKKIWPGWETVGLIGRGSFGAVYKIQRNVLGNVEEAALKVISIPQNAGDIDSLYDDGYDEIILNDDIFIYDENLNDDFYKDDTLFY